MDGVQRGRDVPLSIEMTDVVRQYRAGGNVVRALDGIALRIDGGQFVSVVRRLRRLIGSSHCRTVQSRRTFSPTP
jgi:hypothetical protein